MGFLMIRLGGWGKRIFHARHNFRDFIDSYVAPSAPAVRTPLGFFLTGSNSVHHKAMQAGVFERAEVDWMVSQFEFTKVFIDVGANIGYFSCLARANAARVVAVEPHHQNLQRLLTNVQINDGAAVEVLPVALSGAVGVMNLYGLSSTGASLVANWAGTPSAVASLVPVTTLDNILEGRFANERLLIKIDVEGHEYEVLTGAQKTLDRGIRPCWLVEITDYQFHPNGNNPNFKATFTEFWARGYTCDALTKDGPRPVAADDFNEVDLHQRAGTINYIFRG